MNILCLLPHYDDELFVAPFLQDFSPTLFPCFMTTPEGQVELSKRRAAESKYYLSQYAQCAENTLKLGEKLSIPDEKLIFHYTRTIPELSNFIKEKKINLILSPAWEGGHHDHDASFLVAHKLKELHGIEHCYYLTYTGYRSFGPLFSLFTHIRSHEPAEHSRTVRLCFFVRMLFNAIWYFPSQLKTWLVLSPFILIKTLTRRQIHLYKNTHSGSLEKPHTGTVLYEKHRRFTWNKFEELMNG